MEEFVRSEVLPLACELAGAICGCILFLIVERRLP